MYPYCRNEFVSDFFYDSLEAFVLYTVQFSMYIIDA